MANILLDGVNLFDKHVPDLMAGHNAYENDNNYVLNQQKKKEPLPDNWAKYEKVKMTTFGPIGIKNGEFVYLDQKTQEERS